MTPKGMTTAVDAEGNNVVVSVKEYKEKLKTGELKHSLSGKIIARNIITGETLSVDGSDPRFDEGILVGVTKGLTPARDKFGNLQMLPVGDPRLSTGEFISVTPKGMTTVVDIEGNNLNVSTKEYKEKLKTGELKHILAGKVSARNIITGETLSVDGSDPRFKEGILVGTTKGLTPAKNKNGNTVMVPSDDPGLKDGTYETFNKGKLIVKDIKTGEIFQTDKNNERYLSGELIPFGKGKVLAKDFSGKGLIVEKDDPRLESGELVGISKGRIWIHDNKTKKQKCVNPEDLEKYFTEGWERGCFNRKRKKEQNLAAFLEQTN